MSATPRQRLDAHERSDDVCVRFRRIIDASPGGRRTRGRLGNAVMETSALIKKHRRALADEHSWSLKRQRARRQLRAALMGFITISRVIRGEDAGIYFVDRLPRTSDSELMSKATTMLDKVTTNADVFIEYGLPSTLLENVPVLVAALREAISQQDTARIDHQVLAREVLRSLAAGDRACAAMAVILASMADTHPNAIAAFRKARRVGYSSRVAARRRAARRPAR
ncbi:MAG TPA: hypothetical protein VEU08_20560 [Vicinamibacterales bacterium]|nr:hypothetical protein [Vicinamibacterales bacterium]